MLVFSNQRLGPAAEMMVSRPIAIDVLRKVAAAARPIANGHWEKELVRWLDEQAAHVASAATRHVGIDVGDIAFTPLHFNRQRRFLIEAIQRVCATSEHSRLLGAWANLIEAHPSDSVQYGRRWLWHPSA